MISTAQGRNSINFSLLTPYEKKSVNIFSIFSANKYLQFFI